MKNNNCTPTSSNCIVWQGPNIPCINLCKGDSITDVVYKLATDYCDLLSKLDPSIYDLSCLNDASCAPKNIQQLVQLLINKICDVEKQEGPAGAAGADGADGTPGDTIRTIDLLPGDPQCLEGGVLIEVLDSGGAIKSQTYICNGSDGSNGVKGDDGDPGPIGPVGPQGDPGLIDVINSCAPIENNTDVWAVIDVTSGPYSDWNTGNTTNEQNMQTLANAVYSWYNQYQIDNPSYTGNLYVVASRNESYLNYLSKIRDYNFHIGSDFSFMTQNSGDEFSNTGFIDQTATIISPPAGWGDPSWTPPTSILLISFINESSSAGANYHSSVANPPSLSGQPTNTSTLPDTDYLGDFGLFQVDYPLMDFFQAIIYPANNGGLAALNSLLHQYAVLNPGLITQTAFQAALGDNFTNPTYSTEWSNTFASGSLTNPYDANPAWDLSQYGWSGILDKAVDGSGFITFDSLEFQTDLDELLNVGTSASIINDWNPATGVLTLNGIRSSSLAITQEDGCVNIECGDCAGTTNGLFAQTANSTTISGTLTEETLIGAGVGSLTVPANTFVTGDSYHAKLFGHITAVNSNATVRIKFNAVTVLTLPFSLPNITDLHWSLDIYFTIRSEGASGSVLTGIQFQHEEDAADKFSGHAFTDLISIDTTSSNTLGITMQFDNVSDSIYSELLTLNKTY